MKSRHGLRAATLAVFLTLGACNQKQGADLEREFEGDLGAGSIPVETLTVRPSDLEETYLAAGLIEAEDTVTVSAEISGRILEFPWKVGREIGKGDVIARLDDSATRARIRKVDAQIARIETLLTSARKDFEREQQLYTSNAGAERAFDDAQRLVETYENELAAMKADLDVMKVELERFVILSPLSGVVSETWTEAGEFASPGFRLCTIVTNDAVEFVVSLSERDILRVAKGEKVEVRVDALPDSVFEGTVDLIAPTGDAGTRTFRVWIRLENPEPHHLLPGMSGRARLVRSRYEGVFLLPEDSIRNEGRTSYVFVNAGESAKRREITIAGAVRDRAVIREGLEDGDEVVILGQYAVTDGSAIRVRLRHDTIPVTRFD